jgi:hypothetical protein
MFFFFFCKFLITLNLTTLVIRYQNNESLQLVFIVLNWPSWLVMPFLLNVSLLLIPLLNCVKEQVLCIMNYSKELLILKFVVIQRCRHRGVVKSCWPRHSYWV